MIYLIFQHELGFSGCTNIGNGDKYGVLNQAIVRAFSSGQVPTVLGNFTRSEENQNRNLIIYLLNAGVFILLYTEVTELSRNYENLLYE